MQTRIDCFLPYSGSQTEDNIKALHTSPLVGTITILSTDTQIESVADCQVISVDSIYSSATMRAIAHSAHSDFILLYTGNNTLVPGYFALDRMVKIATDSKAGMVYADYYTVVDGVRSNSPVIDYQFGSLRDDFNFGPLMMFDTADFKKAAYGIDSDYKAAGLYDLRLRLSRIAPLVHINEYLYTEIGRASCRERV